MSEARLLDALKSYASKSNKTDEALQKLSEIFLNRAKVHVDKTNTPSPARAHTITTPKKNNMIKELLSRVKDTYIKLTPNSELNKNIIYETPRETRNRIRNENKQTTWFLSPNNSPVDTPTNLTHLIEPDDHIINNAQCEKQINAVLQDSGELLEHRHLKKAPDASMLKSR